MRKEELRTLYLDYLACLNVRDWDALGRFVHDDVHHNGRPLGLDGYRAMLGADCAQIPDLRYVAQILVVEPPRIACRLAFDVRPRAGFLGLAVNGRRVRFCENVFYEYREGRIREVWSVIDKAAVEAQLG